MKVRVGLYILLILFLLISGKEEARAGRYAAKGDTCRVSDRMNQPETWSKIYQWVMDDPQVPDKEDVLMLIRYHFGNFEKLRKLLRYLDGGRPYVYLSEHQFRKIERTGKMKDSLPVAALTLPANTLPEEQLETIAFAPWLEVESKRETPHRTVLALKNNILYDLALAPNVEVELPVGQRWSLNMEYKCPWWSNSKHGFCYQLLSGGVEARCWLGKRKNHERLTGHFLGIYAEGGERTAVVGFLREEAHRLLDECMETLFRREVRRVAGHRRPVERRAVDGIVVRHALHACQLAAHIVLDMLQFLRVIAPRHDVEVRPYRGQPVGMGFVQVLVYPLAVDAVAPAVSG